MKFVLVIEDTPEGILMINSTECNGVTDHPADSLSTHLVTFLYQHINQLNGINPVLNVTLEEV